MTKFGSITLFGSGETLPASGAAYEYIANRLDGRPRISVVETPAGFQPNSDTVARKVARFITSHLQNHHPAVNLIPARKNEGELSTNNAQLLEPMLTSNWIFIGPGSPTYAVKNLKDSLLFSYLYAMHATECALTFSSAGVLAISALTLPLYEIYKVGEDLHWIDGLNFFRVFGLDFVFIPHWNNNSGGDELDTSRCFMGHDRFDLLKSLLPRGLPIIGIDEQTALTITFADRVMWKITGIGKLTVLHNDQELSLPEGEYDPSHMGFNYVLPHSFSNVITKQIEKIEMISREEKENQKPPAEVIHLADLRQSAREIKDWHAADIIRNKITELGWVILDTFDGYRLTKN